MSEKNYRQCAISVMDNVSDPDITFDENGISNYYYEYQKAAAGLHTGEEGWRQLENIAAEIKRPGRTCLTIVSWA